jgi:hypothetical protein
MAAIQGAGATVDYVAKKARAKVIFNSFAATATSGIVGLTLDTMPEATICSKPVHERFASPTFCMCTQTARTQAAIQGSALMARPPRRSWASS